MNISLEEQETIINFGRMDDRMEIYTTDSTMFTKLDKLVNKNPQEYKVVKEDDVSKTYSCPKKFLSLRSAEVKREYTEEQRQAMAKRLRNARANK